MEGNKMKYFWCQNDLASGQDEIFLLKELSPVRAEQTGKIKDG